MKALAACLVWALTSAVLVNTQCDENTCTILCYPLTWERDLCEFYQQVGEWRDLAIQCGLSLPPLPQSRPGLVSEGLSSDELWQVANNYWQEVTGIWQTRYGGNQEETTPSTDTPAQEATTSDPMDYFSGSGLGSGDFTTQLPTTETTTMPTEEPTTADPVTDSPVIQHNAERWTASNQVWESLFAQWAESSREGAGLRLPTDVDVGMIIDEYGQDQRADRGAWSQLVGFWRENVAVYQDGYGGMCPEQV